MMFFLLLAASATARDGNRRSRAGATNSVVRYCNLARFRRRDGMRSGGASSHHPSPWSAGPVPRRLPRAGARGCVPGRHGGAIRNPWAAAGGRVIHSALIRRYWINVTRSRRLSTLAVGRAKPLWDNRNDNYRQASTHRDLDSVGRRFEPDPAYIVPDRSGFFPVLGPLAAPGHRLVIVYVHGSSREGRADRYRPTSARIREIRSDVPTANSSLSKQAVA